MAAVSHLVVEQHLGLQQDVILLLQFKHKQEEVCQTKLCIKNSRETGTCNLFVIINFICCKYTINLDFMKVAPLQCLAMSIVIYILATVNMLLWESRICCLVDVLPGFGDLCHAALGCMPCCLGDVCLASLGMYALLLIGILSYAEFFNVKVIQYITDSAFQ